MGTLLPSSQNNVRVGPISRKIIWPVKTGGVELFQRTTIFLSSFSSGLNSLHPLDSTRLQCSWVYFDNMDHYLCSHLSNECVMHRKEQTRRLLIVVYVTAIAEDTWVLCNCAVFVTVEIESCHPPPPKKKFLHNAFFESYKGNISWFIL